VSIPTAQAFDQNIKTQNAPPLRAPLFLTSILGTILEYFEYAIYGFLAPMIAQHFFSQSDPTSALINAFGVFAVGSLSKPIGALIFGHLGDTQGRRLSLRYSMIGISIPTFIVGILPGYDVWGWGAAFALILCRMLQGIFIAGESDGVRIYVFEHFGHKNPCLMINLVGCGAYIGIALAAFIATQISDTGDAWRYVFLGCSACGIVVFFLRRFLVETPPFLEYRHKHPSSSIPMKKIVQYNWRALVRTIMICGAGGGAYHFFLVFQGMYLSKILELISFEEATFYGFWLTGVYVVFLPIAGWAADIWGLSRTAKIGGLLTLSHLLVHIGMIINGIVFFPIMFSTTISMVFFFAPAFLFLLKHYDVGIRFRCLSLGHTIGSMLFSGSTPVVCLFLWKNTLTSYIPYLYFLFLVSMGLAAFVLNGKSKSSPLRRLCF